MSAQQGERVKRSSVRTPQIESEQYMFMTKMRRLMVTAAVSLVALVGVQGAAARTAYVAETDLANAIESYGFSYSGKRRAVDMASCSGLRRYGVREVRFVERYVRFKCSIDTSNGEWWELRIRTDQKPGGNGWTYKVLTAKKLKS
jgi:hypothetical protein